MSRNPLLIIGVVIALLASVAALVFGQGGTAMSFGNTSGTSTTQAIVKAAGFHTTGNTILAGLTTLSGTFRSGASGTEVSRVNTGQCYFKAYATTIAATSSAYVDCQGTAAVGSITGATSALSGVTFGDNVVLQMSTTTTGTTLGGLVVAGVSASTTQGYIQVRVTNLTGTTFTWPLTGTATGTASYMVTK